MNRRRSTDPIIDEMAKDIKEMKEGILGSIKTGDSGMLGRLKVVEDGMTVLRVLVLLLASSVIFKIII